MKSYSSRVQAGAAWLDEQMPDWADKIDLPTLELASGEFCVLGQLYSDQALDRNGFNWAVEYGPLSGANNDAPCQFGFDTCDDDWDPDELNEKRAYRWLTVRWRQLIQSRRKETSDV